MLIQVDEGLSPNYTAIAYHCNLWRNYGDIQDSWASVLVKMSSIKIFLFFSNKEQKLGIIKNIGSANTKSEKLSRLFVGTTFTYKTELQK